MEDFNPTPRIESNFWVYLGNTSGCRPHILSIYHDVHCVICPPPNAHTTSHLEPR